MTENLQPKVNKLGGRRTLTIIDGYVFWLQMNVLGFPRIDYGELMQFCMSRGTQVSRPIHFQAHRRGRKNCLEASNNAGFEVVTKLTKTHPQTCSCCHRLLGKCPFCHVNLNKEKGDFDADIGYEMASRSATYNYLLLFAADGDFKRSLQKLQSLGIAIELVSLSPDSTARQSHCLTSRELFDVANIQTPLESVAHLLGNREICQAKNL